MRARRWITACMVGMVALLAASPRLSAQELDMELPPLSPQPAPQSMKVGKPLSITITKTQYLPPAMYGQWSVTGSLLKTNVPDYFSPTVQDIWVLARDGDQVIVSNPANGASAAVNVDKVEGDTATFHREIRAGRNWHVQEVSTITVHGDTLTGRNAKHIEALKNGKVVRQHYAIYALQATRIGSGQVRFRPEALLGGPEIEIEDIRKGSSR